MMRLNKFIAHYSTYSRREADKAIADGYVRINGEIETNPATQVDERADVVYISGKQVSVQEKHTVIVYNKPKGELVTKSDPKGRRTIYESLGKEFRHYIPVGRLDYASEGLLLLTDASHIATALMESNLERIYKVKIKGEVTQEMEQAMLSGIFIEDASAGAHSHSKITSMEFKPFLGYKIQKNSHNYSILKVAISEGKNRELRRFFAHFNAEVADLKRLSFAEIELNNLPTGKTRFLTRSEYSALHTFLKAEEKLAREKSGNKPKPRAFASKDESKKDDKRGDNKKPITKKSAPKKGDSKTQKETKRTPSAPKKPTSNTKAKPRGK